MRPSSETNFWQLLLAAELPFAKASKLAAEIKDAPSELLAIEALCSNKLLSEAELRRIDRARTDSSKSSNGGAFVVVADNLSGQIRESLPGLQGIWAIGDGNALYQTCIAIVGTRGATAYGKACAMKFAEAFSKAGAVVVSGGAFGIDAAAHRGALEANGKTIAVMPCGVDVSYPASHRGLFAEIRSKGLQVSQFACGMQPRHDTFLTRNMLIAAISQAVLIVEAPEASGALHTANRAADMGKQVYVAPGAITQGSFRGSHQLIRSGATLVDHPNQILEELAIVAPIDAADTSNVNEVQRRILELLSSEPISSEKLAESADLDPAIALGELTMLELDGRVIRSFGGFVLAP